MAKYHITSKGEPGVCRATSRPCPLGGEEEHYGSKAEAQQAYEKKMGESTPPPSVSPKSNDQKRVEELMKRDADFARLDASVKAARQNNHELMQELAATSDPKREEELYAMIEMNNEYVAEADGYQLAWDKNKRELTEARRKVSESEDAALLAGVEKMEGAVVIKPAPADEVYSDQDKHYVGPYVVSTINNTHINAKGVPEVVRETMVFEPGKAYNPVYVAFTSVSDFEGAKANHQEGIAKAVIATHERLAAGETFSED